MICRGGRIRLHVNHTVRTSSFLQAIVCPKKVSMRIYYVWLCVQGRYGYVTSVGMYCKFEGTYLSLEWSRERSISRTQKVSEQQKNMGSIGSGATPPSHTTAGSSEE